MELKKQRFRNCYPCLIFGTHNDEEEVSQGIHFLGRVMAHRCWVSFPLRLEVYYGRCAY